MEPASDIGAGDGGVVGFTRPIVAIEIDADSMRRRFLELDRRYQMLLNLVMPLATTLFYERDYDRLLERILTDTQRISRADGGTLYLRTPDDKLEFALVRNDSLGIAMGGRSKVKPPFEALPLYHAKTKLPNHDHIAAHAALTGELFNIPDVYGFERFDFSGTKAFDARTGYRSKSFVTVPLKANSGRVIGVMQMINARNDAGEVVCFDEATERIIETLATMAAAALERYQHEASLEKKIKKLKVEIDHGRRREEVSQIADTDYFKQLQTKAAQLRRRAGRGPGGAAETP